MAIAAACVIAVAAVWPPRASPHNPITTTVLFNREVAKILQQKCLQCHSGDGMAMDLTTYAEARPWAVAIKEEVLARRMPPWPAEPGYGQFANDVGLTARDREFLVSWIDGGVPEGDGAAPAYLDHSAHWMLGTPDALVTAKPGVVVEPGRPIEFQRFIIDTGVTRETWLRAIDYKPSDKRVVRAAFFTVAGTGQYLGGWSPWRTTLQVPDGTAIRLPARARIAVDVLYQSAPDRVVDTPQLGLYFAGAAPAREITTTVLEPPVSARTAAGAGSSRLTAAHPLRVDTAIVEVRPELGPGARSIEVKAKRPDGSSQVLLWIRKFREEWQTSYVFQQPQMLPKGTVLQAVAYFDAAPAHTASPLRVVVSSYEPPPAPVTDALELRPPASARQR